MARILIVAIALALPLLAGCKGMYVAGDAGAHGADFSAPPAAPRALNDPSR